MSTRQLKVFLCHSSGVKPAVRTLYQRLQSTPGIKPWLDEIDLLPGQDWELEIRSAVQDADVVIVCLSTDSITKRGFVQKEIKYALDVADEQAEGTIFLIPLRLEECEVPQRLQNKHWVNYFEQDGFDKLANALRRRAEEIGATTGFEAPGKATSTRPNYSLIRIAHPNLTSPQDDFPAFRDMRRKTWQPISLDECPKPQPGITMDGVAWVAGWGLRLRSRQRYRLAYEFRTNHTWPEVEFVFYQRPSLRGEEEQEWKRILSAGAENSLGDCPDEFITYGEIYLFTCWGKRERIGSAPWLSFTPVTYETDPASGSLSLIFTPPQGVES